MDFNVEQLGATQVVYVLPLGAGKTLVELTRFGLASLTPPEANPVLDLYITQRFGNYQILHTDETVNNLLRNLLTGVQLIVFFI
jgi:hypothetical protein